MVLLPSGSNGIIASVEVILTQRWQILFRGLWLLVVAAYFDGPKQMRERELSKLPLAAFLDINLSHHEGIGNFMRTDYCLQIHVFQQDRRVAEYACVHCINEGFLYQMPPLSMVASSCTFPQVPPM
jgi:hypothetical protein